MSRDRKRQQNLEKPEWELMLEQQDAHLQLNNAAEVVGKVQQDLSIKVFQATDFGSNIGTDMVTFLYNGRSRSRGMMVG